MANDKKVTVGCKETKSSKAVRKMPSSAPEFHPVGKNTYRLSLAYMELADIPSEIMNKLGASIVELDLSHNKISDLRFLIDLPCIQTLVLDHNHVSSQVKMPLCRELHTLWVNHNHIQNLSLFIHTISKNCPSLRILSMMNNEAAPSYFNGGTYQQYLDYRYYVISSLFNLQVLDYTPITDSERREARRLYPMTLMQKSEALRNKCIAKHLNKKKEKTKD